jgi:radical SAM superfamily enzyme YgiQ (UPF0313 family)
MGGSKSLDVLLVLPPVMNFSSQRFTFIDNASFEIDEPLGICYIGAVLEKAQIKTEILDMGILKLSYERFKKILLKKTPKIIGFSVTSITYEFTEDLIEITHETLPNTPIIIGGNHCTLFPNDVIQNKLIDYLVVGEGEYTMLELSQYLLDNTGDLSDIKGLIYKDFKGKIIINPQRPLEKNLDKFPFPAKHLIIGNNPRKYFSSAAINNPTTAIITHRGCPYNCTFCSKIFKKPRFRSVENILEEIDYIYSEEKIKDIQFRDNTFNLNQKQNIGICKGIIKNQYDFHWRALVRPDLLNEKLVRYYKKSHCYLLSLGAESGSERILKILKKGYNKEQIRNAFALTRKYNIETHGYFMIGVPGETFAEIKQTFKFIREINPLYLNIQIYSPIPGSELYDVLVKKNMIDKTFQFSKLKGVCRPYLNLRNLPNKLLTNMRRYGLFRHFINPKYLKKVGTKILTEPLRYIKNIYELIKFWSS